jgi:predicted MPP superfamily phosphohydrolase
MRVVRGLLAACLIAVLLCLAVLGYAYLEATRDPVVRRADVAVADWPAGEPPRTVLLISDVHVAGPDMPPERLARIVGQVNALRPDLIALTGDYVSYKGVATARYTAAQIVATLAGLHAPLGVVAVLGNHNHDDHATDFRGAFASSPITLIDNGAVRRRPFRVGGIDDLHTGPADIPAMERALTELGDGPALILSHNPDIVPMLTAPSAAVLAGHTHCGQIVLPFYGPLATMSRYGRRFACGRIEEHGRTTFVSAGLGTSLLPLRLGAPPDVWLIRFGPRR